MNTNKYLMCEVFLKIPICDILSNSGFVRINYFVNIMIFSEKCLLYVYIFKTFKTFKKLNKTL